MSVLDELFSAYYKDIYRYLYSLCRDASLSEDLTSEVFLEVVKSIGGFRADSGVKTCDIYEDGLVERVKAVGLTTDEFNAKHDDPKKDI